MAIKTLTIDYRKINELSDNRLSPSYYYVDVFFERFDENVKTLEELGAEISSGSYIDTYLEKEQGVTFIRVGNVKPFNMDENEDNLKYVSHLLPEKIKVKENDIVLGRTQAVSDKLAVASIIDKDKENSVISQHVSRIRIKSLSPYYLIAYLNSNFYKAQTALATRGDTRVEMTHSQLKNVKVFIPKKDKLINIETTVKQIVDDNSKSLNLIKKARSLFYKQVQFQTSKRQDRYSSVNYMDIKQSNNFVCTFYNPLFYNTLKEIKSKFRTISLGEIANIVKGDEVGSSNYVDYLYKGENYVPFIRTSDVVNYEIDQYPDYFVSEKIYNELEQGFQNGDVLFTKDGKIGMVGMITENDKAIISSGFVGLRLKNKGIECGITPEYLFLALSIKEIGIYASKRRTVVASTIPHLREERLKEIEIPILDKETISEITDLVKQAFKLKDEKKRLIAEVRETMDGYFKV